MALLPCFWSEWGFFFFYYSNRNEVRAFGFWGSNSGHQAGTAITCSHSVILLLLQDWFPSTDSISRIPWSALNHGACILCAQLTIYSGNYSPWLGFLILLTSGPLRALQIPNQTQVLVT